MKEHKLAISLQTFRQLARAVKVFLKSHVGGKAMFLAASLLLLMLTINGMNVLNSFVGRYFMSSIEKRDAAGFLRYAWLYVAVFAGSTVIAVFFRFCEERLGLLWRDYLTHRIVGHYIDQRIYLFLGNAGELTNPDQRITEDVRQLTTTTLSFVLMLLNGTITAISFSGVLWSISPKLFVIAVLYAAMGSGLTILLGRPLIRLNYQQSDFEANFRSELIHVRENADGIALTGNDSGIRDRVTKRVDDLVENFKRIIRVNRNLGFFIGGYNYMIPLIPTLVVAPLFMHQGVEFGVIAQAGMAFAALLGAFSLVITQFQTISSYASVITRLEEFLHAAEKAVLRSKACGITYSTLPDRFSYSDLTLRSTGEDGTVVLKSLNASFVSGERVLVNGPNRLGRTALFRASARLYDAGTGKISRPPGGKLVFLPERPFLPPLPLREALAPPARGKPATQEEMASVIREMGLEAAVKKHDGFDSASNWLEVLSLQEQQRLSIARAILAKPEFVFLEQLDSALSEAEEERVLKLLAGHGITCVSFGELAPDPARHDACLELKEDGSWTWTRLR